MSIRLPELLPPIGYDDLVAGHERELAGIPVVHIRRNEAAPHRRLMVVLATHNEGRAYTSLVSSYRAIDADLLFLRDEANSYYLHADRGAAVDRAVAAVAGDYAPEETIFFGSSMAGYAALRFALDLNGNAILNNPQINLEATKPVAWPELRNNIAKIPTLRELDDERFPDARCAIALLHSRHAIDLENMRRFFDFYRAHPGLSLLTVHADENDHKFLFPSLDLFLRIVDRTLELRKMADEIIAWGRVPKQGEPSAV